MDTRASAYEPLPPAFQVRKPVRGLAIWWLRFAGIGALIAGLLVHLARSPDVSLARIDVRWLVVAAALTVCQLLLEALAWRGLLASQHIRYPYPKTLVAYLASQYLGLVTPNHVGELLAAGHISVDTGITFGYALSSVVLRKLLSTVAAVGFGLWSLPLLADLPFLQGVRMVVWSAVVVVTFSGGIALWVLSLRRLARKWEQASQWKIDAVEFWAGMRQLFTPGLVVTALMAAVSFSLLFFQLEVVTRAMGVALPFVLGAKLMALSRITSRLVPLSVVGFGSKDVLLILLLRQQGLSLAVSLTATLLLLVCSHLVTLLLSGLCWRIKPLVVRRAVPASS
jgi:uncharacterized membrane protein YbhN (UPF0104 family)